MRYPRKPMLPSPRITVIRMATPRGMYLKCASHSTAGYTSAATAIATSTHAMTRSELCRIRNKSTVSASPKTSANALRIDSRTRTVRAPSAIGSYDTDVSTTETGSSSSDAGASGIDFDPASAIPLGVAVALLAILVWFVRSTPRTLSSLAIATLFALALNPLVDRLKRRTGWHRRTAAAVVLMTTGLIAVIVVALITVPTIREVRDLNKQIPKTVKDLGTLPVIGPRLREADASRRVQEWLDEVPDRLSVDATPIESAAGTIADGVAAALITILLAITLVLVGEHIVNGVRRLVPARRRDDAD